MRLLLSLTVLLTVSVARGQEKTLKIKVPRNKDSQPTSVDVTGIGPELLKHLKNQKLTVPQWQELLAIYLDRGRKPTDDDLAMLGDYQVLEKVIRFKPRYPFAVGGKYIALLRPDQIPQWKGSTRLVSHRFSGKPLVIHGQPEVTGVFPSSNKLPENLLKFYIQFSKPMAQGRADRYLSLYDAKGKKIDFSFLIVNQELWSRDGKRLTLFFDPGRIKRELTPRQLLGPTLHAGRRYALVIEKGWADSEGGILQKAVRKEFQVTMPDEESPDVSKWKLEAPAAGTKSPLIIRFQEPLDHELLFRMLTVLGPDTKPVAGSITVKDHETVWEFKPAQSWKAGKHSLRVSTKLEDRSGNNVGEPFEIDLKKKEPRKKAPPFVDRAFLVVKRK